MERFYHIRVFEKGNPFLPPRTNGGATVHLTPGDDPMHVLMRVAYCNPSDVYCKREGREHCIGRPERVKLTEGRGGLVTRTTPPVEAKEPVVVHLRQLPGAFAKIHREVHRRSKMPWSPGLAPNYESRIREWLPKD